MSFLKRMESQLARLEGRIKAAQEELTGLKKQRNELKAKLTEAKRACKQGNPLPTPGQSEGLVGRIGAALTENVVEPITELLTPAPEKARP